MAQTFVKVIGLQRSGTNYLDGVVRRNFASTTFVPHKVLWKHDVAENVPPEFPSEALILLVHKSPYSWIESLTRSAKDLWKYHDLTGLEPEVLIRRGNYEGKQIPASVPRLCKIYSTYHLGWTRSGRHVVPVRFERLIDDVESVVEELVGAGLERRGEELELEFDVNQSRRLSDADLSRLADQESFDLGDAAIEAISRFVDPAVWPALGRQPIAARRSRRSWAARWRRSRP